MTSPQPSALTLVREEAKTALEGAVSVRVFTIIPAKTTPPLVWVSPGSPYVTFDGASFGGGRFVNLELVGAVAAGANEVQAAALDALILQICEAVDDSESFVLGDVGQPGQVTLNGQTYLACAVSVTREIHI